MDVFQTLRRAANPERAKSMSAYMRNQFAYLGIQTQKRRKLSREFLQFMSKTQVDWDFVFKCWEQPEREFQYLAMDYLRGVKSLLTPKDIPRLRGLALDKSWWDTIDSLDVTIGDIALDYPEVNQVLLEWSLDENFWLRRIAIDHQLIRKEKTDTYLLEQIIVNNLGQTEFFINKAIGWSLRNYSKTNPDWVRGFLDRYGDRMAALSVREASKYV